MEATSRNGRRCHPTKTFISKSAQKPQPKTDQLKRAAISGIRSHFPGRIFRFSLERYLRSSTTTIRGLGVTIGRYWYLVKRLTAVSAGRFYRFEHIVAYSSGKVVAKYRIRSAQSPLNPAMQ